MRAYQAEALVVNGHGLTPNEELDTHSRQRMDAALGAWNNGIAPTLALSGNHSFRLKNPPKTSEAAAMKDYAVQHDVPESVIKVENKSLDTIGNALFTKTDLAIPNAWERLVVVTSHSHFERTLQVYKHVFGRNYSIKGIVAPENIGRKERILEPLGSVMVDAILHGTKPGDHDAIKERLFNLVPGYDSATLPRLACASLTSLVSSVVRVR